MTPSCPRQPGHDDGDNRAGYPRGDFHVHSPLSACGVMSPLSAQQVWEIAAGCADVDAVRRNGAAYAVPRMLRQAEARRLTHLGVSDHLYTGKAADVPDRSRRAIADWQHLRRLFETAETAVRCFVGAECDLLEGGRVCVTEQEREHLDYVICGAFHWSQWVIQRDFGSDARAALDFARREILAAIENPVVDGIAHCFPINRPPGFALFDIDLVDEAFARAIGERARDCGTAIEVSSRFDFSEGTPYRRALDQWMASGCLLYFGSDAHVPAQIGHNLDDAIEVLRAGGVGPERIWTPGNRAPGTPGRPSPCAERLGNSTEAAGSHGAGRKGKDL